MNTKTPLRALVVEDYPSMARIVAKFCRQAGFGEVDIAGDGVEALEKMRAAKYDLVISDWEMPNLDGPALLRAAKQEPALAGVPFIIMTGDPSLERRSEALEAGAAGFLGKPFMYKQLAALVMKAVPELGGKP